MKVISHQLSVVRNKNHQFRKLKVWQFSIKFVSRIYQITANYPQEEKYGLTDQLRRAAVSICLNIAEGSGAGSDAEFIRFLRIAQRSAYEVIAALEISINLSLLNKANAEIAFNEVDQISAMLNGLIKRLKAED